MLSKYFQMKIQTEEFKKCIDEIFENHKGKRIIIYGAGEGFSRLNQLYNFNKNLNVVAIADKKFELKKTVNYEGFQPISPNEIKDIVFDYIIVTNETNSSIVKFLTNTLNVQNDKILTLFNETIKDAAINYGYLEKLDFSKNLKKLKKKLKNKTIVIYGAGAYFELIQKYYDLEGLNIIGISDKRYDIHEENETKFGYKVYSINEIKELKPDYLLVATKFYVNIIEDLYYNLTNKIGINIKPLVKKRLFTLIKEIWG